MTLIFNMGAPMIIPSIYFMVFALLPIVLIESSVISRSIRIKFTSTVGSVALGNIVSTLVGIPVTWGALFVLQIITGGTSAYGVEGIAGKILTFTLQAPWLLPLPDGDYWTPHLAVLFLLIPYFFVTWLIEYWLMRDKLAAAVVETHSNLDLASAERLVWTSSRRANLISYGLIALLVLVSFSLTAAKYN